MTSEDRILEKLDDISDRTARLEERVGGLSDRIDKYNNVTGRMYEIESDLRSQRESCQAVQKDKKNHTVPWGNVKSGIIVGLTVAIIMLLVNYVIR